MTADHIELSARNLVRQIFTELQSAGVQLLGSPQEFERAVGAVDAALRRAQNTAPPQRTARGY